MAAHQFTTSQALDYAAVVRTEAMGPGEHVLEGPPSCGKTEMMLAAIQHGTLAQTRAGDSAHRITVVIAHILGICNWQERCKAYKTDPVISVSRNCFARLRATLTAGRHLLLLCTPTTVRRCLEEIGDRPIQRLVVDDWDSLNIPNFTQGKKGAHNVWFITGNKQWTVNADMRRDVLAKQVHRVFCEAICNTPPATDRGNASVVTCKTLFVEAPEQTSKIFTTQCPLMNATAMSRLLACGQVTLASAAYPGRFSRAEDITDPRARERVHEDCPICYNTPSEEGYTLAERPRVVCASCGNSFCLQCCIKHLARSSECPMCRGNLDLARCTLVAPLPPPPMQSCAETLNSTVAEIFRNSALNRILVVAEFNAADELYVWGAEALQGNMNRLNTVTRMFDLGTCRVLCVNANTTGCPGVRLSKATHVVFVGNVSMGLRQHWSSRAHSVAPGSTPPKIISLNSVLMTSFTIESSHLF